MSATAEMRTSSELRVRTGLARRRSADCPGPRARDRLRHDVRPRRNGVRAWPEHVTRKSRVHRSAFYSSLNGACRPRRSTGASSARWCYGPSVAGGRAAWSIRSRWGNDVGKGGAEADLVRATAERASPRARCVCVGGARGEEFCGAWMPSRSSRAAVARTRFTAWLRPSGKAGLHHRLGHAPRCSGVRAGRRRTLKARLSALPDLQRVAPLLGLIRGGTQQP